MLRHTHVLKIRRRKRERKTWEISTCLRKETQRPLKCSKQKVNWTTESERRVFSNIHCYKRSTEERTITRMLSLPPFVYPIFLFIPLHLSPVKFQRPQKVCAVYLCNEGRIYSNLKVWYCICWIMSEKHFNPERVVRSVTRWHVKKYFYMEV